MLETSRLCRTRWLIAVGLVAAACAAPETEVATTAPQATAASKAEEEAARVAAQAKLAAEARALLAQAETDVQRARAKRALWLKAWEELLDARKSAASNDFSATIRHARAASELAQLGLEQLAYPAV